MKSRMTEASCTTCEIVKLLWGQEKLLRLGVHQDTEQFQPRGSLEEALLRVELEPECVEEELH